MSFGGDKHEWKVCPKGHDVRADRYWNHCVAHRCDDSAAKSRETHVRYLTTAEKKRAKEARIAEFEEEQRLAREIDAELATQQKEDAANEEEERAQEQENAANQMVEDAQMQRLQQQAAQSALLEGLRVQQMAGAVAGLSGGVGAANRGLPGPVSSTINPALGLGRGAPFNRQGAPHQPASVIRGFGTPRLPSSAPITSCGFGGQVVPPVRLPNLGVGRGARPVQLTRGFGQPLSSVTSAFGHARMPPAVPQPVPVPVPSNPPTNAMINAEQAHQVIDEESLEAYLNGECEAEPDYASADAVAPSNTQTQHELTHSSATQVPLWWEKVKANSEEYLGVCPCDMIDPNVIAFVYGPCGHSACVRCHERNEGERTCHVCQCYIQTYEQRDVIFNHYKLTIDDYA